MNFLLDTCVISEAIAKQPNPQVLAFVDNLDPENIYISDITIGEVFKGISKLPASHRKDQLQAWLQDELLPRYDGRIVSLDVKTWMSWGALMARLELSGQVIPIVDSLIAAIVFEHNMTLVTRNVSDFEAAGIKIINPWQ
jgi:tRNA(fMet)-specific endonuclease VapC